MPSRAWANFRPPEWVDREAFLFCGADPAWTPEKEFRREKAPDATPGQCSICGGDGKIELGDLATRTMFVVYLQVAIERGDSTVCARCGRYGKQYLIDGAPIAAALAPQREAQTEKPAPGKAETSGRVPPPPAAADSSSLVVVCAEHPDCVRRGDIHVPSKFGALLERD